MTRAAFLVAPALLALGLSAASARDEAAAALKPLPAPAVSVVEATRRETVETVTVTGTLVPRDEILVTPEIDGYRVTEVLVEEGARVTKGQVLARLARDLIDRQIAQQDAVVAKAEAAVPQSQSSIEQAEAAETEARLSLDRAKTLISTGNTTAVVMETRTSALRQAEGRLAFARNGLAMARADLAQARAVRDELSLRLARTEIRAPVDGIVCRRTARVGLAASAASEPLFRLIARARSSSRARSSRPSCPCCARAPRPGSISARAAASRAACGPSTPRSTRPPASARCACASIPTRACASGPSPAAGSSSAAAAA